MIRRGRPPKPPNGTRVQISCVTSANMKRQLMRAAERNGRSIASEVAARLEWTFDMPRQYQEMQAALRAVLREDHYG
jgi:Arc-like DNA binding domain